MIEISHLGIIGNCRSAALISKDSSIVWSCLPDFDSPSVFAKLLDDKNGGELAIIPDNCLGIHQTYLNRTNILSTKFETTSGNFEVLDFMPIYPIDEKSYYQAPEIYRLINIINGHPTIKIHYNPKLNYAKDMTKSIGNGEYIKSYTTTGEYHSIYLYSNLSYSDIFNEQSILLENNSFILVSYHNKLVQIDIDRVILEFERTKVYWLNWVNRTKSFSLYQNEIIRSALTLKLLTYSKTGAVIAAVTTSIPEALNEKRNWDYRYCWLRDASMILQTLLEINHKNTARGFLRFLLNTMIHKADTLQILYGIRGEKDLAEKTLNYLSGYKNSHPVRIGNAAYRQKQHDVYGVLMELIYSSFLFFPTSLNESEELWTTVRFIMKTIEKNWYKPDRGIWEIRSEKKHFVFSKVLAWVAVDRGIKIAQLLNKTEYTKAWIQLKTMIQADIESKGWNKNISAYTQSYGSNDLDASLLLMENVGYCRVDDPRYISTVNAIYNNLCVNGLVYRYKNKDDFGIPHSAFVICSFWMIDSLYKIGKKKEAVKNFEKLLSYSNHLGLFSEDIDFKTHELLGNFPQGYSHLALINTSMLLNSCKEGTYPFKFIHP